MPFLTRFGVLHLEWQLCVYCISAGLRKQYLVVLQGLPSQDIGTMGLSSTFRHFLDIFRHGKD